MAVTEEKLEDFLAPYREAWVLFTEQRKRGDAWPWVQACMRTRDEMKATRGMESERLPVPDLPHIRVFTWAWYSCRLLVSDKARQMMLTWLGCGLSVHAAMFTPSAREGYQNMTMADTGEKLERYMRYILVNQPIEIMLPWVEEREHPPEEWVQIVGEFFELDLNPKVEPRADQPASFGSEAYLLAKHLTNVYKTSSGPEGLETMMLKPFFDPAERLIEGIPAGPKGPNKWRGGTRTGANHDEAWFQQALDDNLNSAMKSIGDYGHHRIWTTASLGEDGTAYPLKFLEHSKNQPPEYGGFNGSPTMKREDMPHGVEIWQTEMGYTHLRIHHYSDPNKRGEAWVKANVYTGDTRKNLREVLIQYNAPSGEPFYKTFDYMRQKMDRPTTAEGGTLFLFADGGRRPAMGAALIYPTGRVHVILETVTPAGESSNVKSAAIAFKGQLQRDPLTRDLWRDALIICDPSMFDTRGETDDSTSAGVLRELGYNPVKGIQDPDVRYQCVTNLNLLTIPDDKLPALQIDQGACPTFFEAMSGACTLTKMANKTGSNQKEKNWASHIVDAFEYLATYINAEPLDDASTMDDYLMMVHKPRR